MATTNTNGNELISSPTTTPTPVPNSQTTLSPEAPVANLPEGLDKATWERIIGNLNEGWKNARNLFDTRETFYNAYDYNKKSAAEQQLLAGYYDKRMGTNTPSGTTPQIANVAQGNTQPNELQKAQEDVIAQASDANAEAKATFEQQKKENAQMQADLEAQTATSVQNAKEYADAAKAAEEAKLAATQQYEAEIQAEYNRRQQEQIDIMKPLQEKEAQEQKAQLAAMESENRQNEENAKIQADATYQSSLIALNQLGWIFSSAGINTASQIYLQGQMKISTLKAQNKYNEAKLASSIASIEYTHQKEINEIIAESKEKILTSQYNVVKAITDTKKNILLTTKEKNEKIDELLTNARADKKALQDDLYAKMKGKNETLQTNLTRIEAMRTTMQTQAEVKVSEMITSGRWSSLSPQAKAQYAAQTWLDLATIEAKSSSLVSSAIRACLDTFIWKDFVLPASDMSSLYSQIQTKMMMGGYTLERAVTEVLSPYIEKNPEYLKKKKQAEEERQLLLDQEKTKLSLTKAQAEKENVIIANDENGNPVVYNKDTWTFTSYTPSGDGWKPTITISWPATTSAEWLDFVKWKEGFRSEAYWDVNGWAIGYGQHAINWVPVKKWDTINKATADNDFANRVNNAKFNSLITVPLNENQRAALYDLEHNVWGGVWGFESWKKIIDAVNKWDFKKAADIMANSWIGTTNAATGQVMGSLVARRKQAASLLTKDEASQPTTTSTTADEANKMLVNDNDFFNYVMDISKPDFTWMNETSKRKLATKYRDAKALVDIEKVQKFWSEGWDYQLSNQDRKAYTLAKLRWDEEAALNKVKNTPVYIKNNAINTVENLATSIQDGYIIERVPQVDASGNITLVDTPIQMTQDEIKSSLNEMVVNMALTEKYKTKSDIVNKILEITPPQGYYWDEDDMEVGIATLKNEDKDVVFQKLSR